MTQKNSDLVMDRLRLSLSDSEPEDKDLRWDIAKQELASMTESHGPSKADVGYICLLGGILLGVYGVKWFPKTKFVKQGKYVQEAFKAQKKLNKIVIEEYYKFDEALDAEQKFLDMMGADLPLDIKLELVDDAGNRQVQIKFHKRKKGEKEGDNGE